MKNNKTAFIMLLIYVGSSILFLYYSENKQNEISSLKRKIEEQEDCITNMLATQIESNIIFDNIYSTDALPKGEFILAFPNDICDVCNKWIFDQLKECQGFKGKVIIPHRVKKTMLVYDKTYNLHLNDIEYSNDYILPEEYGDYIYIFYNSKEGKIKYPLLLKDKSIYLKTYMNMVSLMEQ